MTDSVRQVVTADGGYAYGVIGADLHVVHGRGPVYLLANNPPAKPAGRELATQPSYLLNARSAVVGFVGRQDEVSELTAWRDSDRRLAVRWLHGPGGQGKTRIAAHLADDSGHAGWKVITADHTAGRIDARNPSSQDLRLGTATGLLLVVDYADRWPLAHLTWLFSNKVLNQDAPVRVLLLARTAHVWPALCHALAQAGWPPDTQSIQRLGALSGPRDRMFTTARDSFARCYGLADPGVIEVPAGLERAEFGLTLAVHMAALAAVDRHAGHAAQPALEDTTRLTVYLLDRERHHWQTQYDTGTVGTAPAQLARTVFTAALTGPLSYRTAKTVLDTADADRVLADHSVCYPPTDPRTVLEPLYPDRLAEDFLALCLPGGPDPWAGAWAADNAARLLTPEKGTLPPYAARAITFLTAASERWPHVLPLLEALEPVVPEDTRGALTIAAAGLTEHLANHRLAITTDPAERARIHVALGKRLYAADHGEKAVAEFQEAVRLYRPLAAADPAVVDRDLADALVHFADAIIRMRPGEHWTTAFIKQRNERQPPAPRHDEAMTALGEAHEIYQRLVAQDTTGDPFLYVARLEAFLFMGRWSDVVASTDLMLAHVRERARENPAAFTILVAQTLTIRLLALERLDRPAETLAVAGEAVEIWRQLAREDPAGHEAELQNALKIYSRVLYNTGRFDESLEVAREAVRIASGLARVNLVEHLTELRSALEILAQQLTDLERQDEALPVAEEAVQISRRLAESDSDRHEESLAGNLFYLALLLRPLHRTAEEAAALDEAVSIRRRLARGNPADHELSLALELSRLGTALATMGRWRAALAATAEAIEIKNRCEQLVQHGVEADFTIAAGMLGADQADPGSAAAEAVAEFRRRFAHDNPAARLYRQLTGADPLAAEQVAGGSDRATSLGVKAMTLRSSGRHEEAQQHAYESMQIYGQLARTDPLTYEPMLVEAMVRTAVILDEMGTLSADALDTMITLRRKLAQRDSARHEPALAVELAVMARNLAKQGRWTEAVAAAAESFDIRRSLGESVGDNAAEEFLTTHLADVELRPEYRAALRAAVADSSRIRRSGR